MRTFIVCTILVFCCLAIGCKLATHKVGDNGMSPTLNRDDGFKVVSLTDESKPINRFDIVLYEPSEKYRKIYNLEKGQTEQISRVIGLPNEKVEIRDNKIYINDKLLEEPFKTIENNGVIDFSPMVIPDNEYFMVSDNRLDGYDSRTREPVTVNRKEIYKKVEEIFPGYYNER